MASIAIVIGGAALNATSFIGGNYLVRYLSGDDKAQAEKERVRNDHALEKYNEAVERFREGQEKLQDFIGENDRLKHQTSQNLVNVYNALKLYNQTDNEKIALKEPQMSDYYSPSSQQKAAEIMYVGGGALVLGYTASRLVL